MHKTSSEYKAELESLTNRKKNLRSKLVDYVSKVGKLYPDVEVKIDGWIISNFQFSSLCDDNLCNVLRQYEEHVKSQSSQTKLKL